MRSNCDPRGRWQGRPEVALSGTPLQPLHASLSAPKSVIGEWCAIATHHAKAALFRSALSSGREASPSTVVHGVEEDAKVCKKRQK
jgi:hypothetical protein